MISSVLETDKQNNRFVVSISDTGSGIKPELLPQLFNQKFTTKENGHGFGLLVCKRIIDSHDGNLKVESTPGIGTTFRIEFPKADRELTTSETQKIKIISPAMIS